MMTKEIEEQVERILRNCIDGALKRTRKNKVFRPFHEALLTKEMVNASAFERSFSTSFGQGPIEEISGLVAKNNGFEVERQKQTLVNIFKGAQNEIERIISQLREGYTKPRWEEEVARVLAHTKGDTEVRRVISDLYLKKEDKDVFISIKTVKPNLDQTEIAKRDLLLLKAHNPAFETYFGLFYNPGGPARQHYNWSVPSKIFDMKKDSCVLIGRDYWDFLGGEGSYDYLLKIFEKVGRETRGQIVNI